MINVAACMSLGRIAFTDTMFCAKNVFDTLGIPFKWAAGGFWEQSLASMWYDRIKEGYEWVLVLDHDTLFDKDDVERLCSLVNTHPEIDALCGTQIKRGCNEALMVPYDFTPAENPTPVPQDSGPLTRLRTGHFGLTLLRLEAIRNLPRPWFRTDTGPKDRMDADVYFWQNWDKAGHTLYQANDVLLGHIQMVVTWPTRDRGIVNQFIGQWNERGKPEAVLAVLRPQNISTPHQQEATAP